MVGARLVLGVARQLELERGVLDVEVPDEARLQLIEQPRRPTLQELLR